MEGSLQKASRSGRAGQHGGGSQRRVGGSEHENVRRGGLEEGAKPGRIFQMVPVCGDSPGLVSPHRVLEFR